MKKLFLVLLLAALVAGGVWFAMHKGGGIAGLTTSSASVTGLLPKETLGLLHVPDVNGTREKWHDTDLYKLWREPAVQDFLQKPLTQIPKSNSVREKLQQVDALQMKDAFLAITAWENENLKLLGGFRFKGSSDDAEKVIGQWRAKVQEAAPQVKRETVTHEQHQIQVASDGKVTVATVYDGNWFFAGNDVAALKLLLDRADGRLKDSGSTLTADETFTAAFKHMPSNYAAFAYGRLDRYFATLAAKLPPDVSTNEQATMLRQIKNFAAASTFDNGKVRDVLFVTMPKMPDAGEITRSSLSLATSDAFLYFASFLNLPHQMPDASKAAANGFPAAMQGLMSAFAEKGITLDFWKSAFGSELGVIGEWPQNARIPALFATLPVKDAAKARQIMTTISSAAASEESTWKTTEKDGVQYFAQPPSNPMVPVAPTVGLSDKLFVAGLDMTSVEAAIKRGSGGSSGLASSQTFKNAEGLVPAAKQSFAYIDTALFYTRLDAAVRPMLIMAAAFMPKIAESVDLGKLPQADVIAKHLSPIVMSQSFQSDGYMTESVGPVSIYQAVIGVAGATGLGATLFKDQAPAGSTVPPDEPDDTADVSPSPEPEETPDSEP
jgi:hypothetical protein